ncbi:MAG: nitroreductase family deazaflavin-dependent oxidoreductase [Actinomycetota bacterium]|nr:nitroreductase family deazaflavin-dependent oxidoreductase [Actinomycetota bacterium]
MLFGDEHIRRYEETDGQVGHDWHGGVPALVLTTTGRKTGEDRKSALIYQKVGDNYVVVASAGGQEKNPGWYRNLVAHPDVRIQVWADKLAGTARTSEGDERAALWDKMVGIFPDYAKYQGTTDRVIPVVVIEPTTT